MARVIIEDRTTSPLNVELTAARDAYGPGGPRAAEGWHVVAFEDGSPYVPNANLKHEHAMLGEFATHDIPAHPTRPHVASGLCSCVPVFDAEANEWVHADKRGATTSPQEAPQGPTSSGDATLPDPANSTT